MSNHEGCGTCMLTTLRARQNDPIRRIEWKYPRLIRLMQFVACLSTSEAACCIRDHRNGFSYGGEAVNHYGGTLAVLQAAIRLRTNYSVRDMLQ